MPGEEFVRQKYLESLVNEIPSRRGIECRTNYNTSVLSLAGIPRMYQDVELSDFDFGKDKTGKMAEKLITGYIENIHDAFDSCVNILIYGTSGTGKSYTASIILKKAFEHYYSIKMETFAMILNNVFAKTNTLEEYAKYEFLCIDEVGKENRLDSKANVLLLEQLVRLRDQRSFPTIICTNLDLKELTGVYGNSLMSLMSQGITICMQGNDRRKDVIVNRDGFRKVMGWEE